MKIFKLIIQVILALIVVQIVPLWFVIACLFLGLIIQLND